MNESIAISFRRGTFYNKRNKASVEVQCQITKNQHNLKKRKSPGFIVHDDGTLRLQN